MPLDGIRVCVFNNDFSDKYFEKYYLYLTFCIIVVLTAAEYMSLMWLISVRTALWRVMKSDPHTI